MIKFRRTIFFKLFLTFLAILFISFILFSSISFFLFKTNIQEQYYARIIGKINNVEQLLFQASQEGWSEDTIQATLELSIDNQNEVYFFLNEDGEILFQVGKQTDEDLINQDIITRILAGEKITDIERTENHNRVFITGSSIESTYNEKAVILASYGFDHEFTQIRALFSGAVIPTIIIIALLIFLVSKRITIPLKKMSDAAHSIAEGDFSHLVKVTTKDEIGSLGESFNFMAEELGNTEKMRRDFIANVSHDLRSPLTSLRGFLTAFLDGTIPEAKQHFYMKIMKEQTDRQIKLVNDLLDLAKMEANHLELNPRFFNMTEEIRMIFARMDPELTKRNIQIELITDENEDITVYADRDRIDQVIMNLLQNAIQFSPEKGKIEISLETQGNLAEFSIQDYGIGIKEENLKYIWQRFYKEDESRSNHVGTGIGLSIVKQIIESHRSTIHVTSSEGGGTRFAFKLSLNQDE
jgi:signal transduction histidine kinase